MQLFNPDDQGLDLGQLTPPPGAQPTMPPTTPGPMGPLAKAVDPDMQALLDSQSATAEKKGLLGALGGALQGFADVPTAAEMLYNKKVTHANPSGVLNQAASQIQDPMDQQSKAMAYLKAKRENDSALSGGKADSSDSQAYRDQIGALFPNLSGVIQNKSKDQIKEMFPLLTKKIEGDVERQNKLAEIDAQKTADLRNKSAEISQTKKADLERMEAGKRLDIEKANAEPPKPDQSQAAVFGRRMEGAEKVFKDLTENGYNRADLKQEGSARFLPAAMQNEGLRKQDQAERNFVNAVLRKESGAAISKDEFASAEQQYFPRPGDTKDVLAQKEANRQQALQGMKVMSGKAWDKMPLVEPASGSSDLQKAAAAEIERRKKAKQTAGQ